ncbi:TetR/AcrR family transcriptional regulator [Treponema phagedenis]|uniref:TetR/AcrR family transcriptional regulator n=1 Tax=Treponema phagedenis TaxID=162 RepID=A0A0B7GW39_TREPH|nr:TetR/AcrR family transcriptional regulator [Treponema phagedenis]QEJ97211.1 TetR/AcrR family transcriptional regulator [Treponema phagedenis]CEM62889.1 Transcriptional regulator, TetR family [Treponema phagedenis]
MCAKKRLPAEVRKKEIRDAAKQVFLQKGFSNTSMEDVIAEVGMSKGGVYRHYKSTAEMLHDLMTDGNHNRYNLIDDFLAKEKNISEPDVAIEVSLMKLLDKNDYKSLYAMFLMEAEKNPDLKKLKNKIFNEGKKEFLRVVTQRDLKELECFISDEWVAFTNAIIVATEILDVRKVFCNHKDFFKDIIRQYMEKSQNKNNF